MKKMQKYFVLALMTGLVLFFATTTSYAGNEDRTGQAGASELLINPWARSSGWGSANSASIRGLESQFLNVAGIAFTTKTEIIFSRTNWLQGSGININAFGFTQKLGENGGVLGFGIMSMNFGEIDITTVNQPDGGIGTFNPSYMNINISYAKAFSNSIFGGINFKIIDERIPNASASGLAIDAGIQYVTGELENIKFGISMKNVGPTMKFSGDGFSFKGIIPGQDNSFTIEQRSADFELPSLIMIGGAYDFYLAEDHMLTVAGNFISNAFTKDNYILGMEYNWRKILMVRGGYNYEKDILSDYDAGRTNAHTGPHAGLTIQAPMNKEKGSTFALDYAYRFSNPFSGTHSIGVRINL